MLLCHCRAGRPSREQQATPDLIIVTHGPAADAPRRHRVPRAANTFPPSSLRPRSLQTPLPALVESAPPLQRERGGSLGGIGAALAASAAAAFAAAGDLHKQHGALTVHAHSMPPQSAIGSRLPPLRTIPDDQLASNTEAAEMRTTRRASKVARRSRRSSQVGHQR